jgi:hypothetical protein
MAKKTDNSDELDAVSMFAYQFENEIDMTTDSVIEALEKVSDHIADGSALGDEKARAIIDGFGGETKLGELISSLAGLMGKSAGVGLSMGTAPINIMSGTAKGVYRKITK